MTLHFILIAIHFLHFHNFFQVYLLYQHGSHDVLFTFLSTACKWHLVPNKRPNEASSEYISFMILWITLLRKSI